MKLPKAAVLANLSQVDSDRQFGAELLGAVPHLRAFSAHLCGRNLGEDMAQEALIPAWKM
jgi:DNA-directed RNA polymerase specialized sigma24 family protein